MDYTRTKSTAVDANQTHLCARFSNACNTADAFHRERLKLR